MRLWCSFLYCLLLTIAVIVWFAKEHDSSGLVASAPLPANSLLQPKDLRPAKDGEANAVIGHYLQNAVAAGAPVHPTDTAPLPALTPKQGSMQVLIPIPRDLVTSRAVNAGTMVRLCQGNKALVDPAIARVTVQAVICGRDPTMCIAVAEVPTDKIGAISPAFASAVLPSLRPVEATCV